MKKSFIFIFIFVFVFNSLFASEKIAEIVFTSDIHSHLDPFNVYYNGGIKPSVMGGIPQIKALIDNFKAANPNLLAVDGGDFSMGTLYQTVFEKEAAELRMLGRAGIEATTFGNHEFDFGDESLARMIDTARNSGDRIPLIISSDTDISGNPLEGVEDCISKYAVFQKGDVKIAVFAVMGEDSRIYTPLTKVKFGSAIDEAKRVVAEIKNEVKPDMIVCLSHSGVNLDDKKKSEDEQLALAVPEIDFILSGHTHTYYAEPIIHGNTVIGMTGEYGSSIGHAVFSQRPDGRWSVEKYEIVPVDGGAGRDIETEKSLALLHERIDDEYLSDYGLSADEILAENNAQFPLPASVYDGIEENALGNFLSDAIIYKYNKINPNGRKADVAFVPSGLVRDTVFKGKVKTSDAFLINSLGTGTDGRSGYPLCAYYLTGAELCMAAEVVATITKFMSSANLHFSGLKFTVNTARPLFNRVSAVFVKNSEGKYEKIDRKKLYLVVSDSYSLGMVSEVGDLSKGLIKFSPKDSDGKVHENSYFVLHDENGREVKAWTATADYIKSFDTIEQNDIAFDGRRVVYGFGLKGLFGNYNIFTLIYFAAFVIILLLIYGFVCLVLYLIKKFLK